MEGLENILYRLHPVVAKDRIVACHLPVLVSQTDGITEGVDLVLTLEHLRLHLCIILLPAGSCRSIVIGIGITVDVDTLQLTQDNTTKHFSQFLVFVGKGYVRPHLCTGVAKPHGRNIACIYKGIVITIFEHTIVNSTLQGVGITVGKHPGEFGILLQKFLYLLDFLLYCHGGEETFLHRWAFRLILAIDRCHHLGIASMNIYFCMSLCHGCHGCKKCHCQYCLSHFLGLL